jgi:hypothetical protein
MKTVTQTEQQAVARFSFAIWRLSQSETCNLQQQQQQRAQIDGDLESD